MSLEVKVALPRVSTWYLGCEKTMDGQYAADGHLMSGIVSLCEKTAGEGEGAQYVLLG